MSHPQRPVPVQPRVVRHHDVARVAEGAAAAEGFGLPGVPYAVGAPDQVVEAQGPPLFLQSVRQYAGSLRNGEIGVTELPNLLRVANQVTHSLNGTKNELADPTGKIFTDADEHDAALLYHARRPERWVLDHEGPKDGPPDPASSTAEQQPPDPNKLTYEKLAAAAKVFSGQADRGANGQSSPEGTPPLEEVIVERIARQYMARRSQGQANPPGNEQEIPELVLERARRQLDTVRRRAAYTLGITEGLELHDLAAAIQRRLELSDAVAAGKLNEHFLPRLLRQSTVVTDANAPDPAARAAAESPPGASAPAAKDAPPPAQSVEPPAPPSEDAQQAAFTAFQTGGRSRGESEEKIRWKGNHRRPSEARRWLGRAAVSAVISAAVTVGLRTADVVLPGGSVVLGGVVGALGATTFALVRVIKQKEGFVESVKEVGKAIVVGGTAGALAALGVGVIADALSGVFSDGGGPTLSQAPDPTPDPGLTPDPPPAQPPVDVPTLFEGQIETTPFDNFTGADGADNNPFFEECGTDAIADKVDALYQQATGTQFNWDNIDKGAFNDLVQRIMEQNGETMTSPVHPGQTLKFDGQLILDFLNSQSGGGLSLTGPKAV